MRTRVKTARRRGYTKVSAKNQVTIPQDALVRAGLQVGDRLRAEARGPGELILVREDDPIDRFAEVLMNQDIIDDAGLEAIKTDILRQFNEAVEIAKREPQPTLSDLTTDVFA